MKTSTITNAAIVLAFLASPVSAQMRVQGTRPIDPRLRNQPVLNQTAKNAQDGSSVPAADAKTNPAADETKTVRNVPSKAAGGTGSSEARGGSGPLKRPSYLGGGENVPSAGPSSLDLMKQCFDGSISGTIANPACVGYIAGYVGAIRMSSGVKDFPICLPEGGLSNESLVADVSAYLEEKPDALQKSARSVFFVVMSDRWPCSP